MDEEASYLSPVSGILAAGLLQVLFTGLRKFPSIAECFFHERVLDFVSAFFYLR